MPSKNKITASTKLSEEESEVLTEIANAENISISAIIKLCLDGVINGDIRIENGELKIGGDPIGYAVSEDFESEKYGSKIERGFEELTEKGYPDQAKRMYEEQIYEQMHNMPKYSPKRACFDEGC